MNANRLEILQKIESGEVTPEEGLRLLNSVEEPFIPEAETTPAVEIPAASVEVLPPSGRDAFADFSRFRSLSWILFGAFLILTLISANWMVQGWLAHNFGWGFWLSWIPFGIGVLGMATSFNARWLHLRVSENKNSRQQNIRISMPLSLGLASWVLKAVSGWLPQDVRDKNIGGSLGAINRSISRDEPFYLEVDEDDEHVEIYIG